MSSMQNGGNTTLAERLRQARVRLGLKQVQVAEKLGVKQQAVQQWEAGKTTPSRDNLLALSSLYEVSAEWLALGIIVSEETSSKAGILPASTAGNRGRLVAVLRSIDDIVGFDPENWHGPTVRTRGPVGPRALAFTITTRANWPEFNPGDEVVIDPDVTPVPGDMVVATVGDDMPIFRRYRSRGQQVELVPVNEDWETVVAPREQIQFHGVMLEHTKFRRP